ncbi:MAG: sigma 54-interacting transcriptional regulator [Acidobacteriota bacterium]|nr:sigma 54-interacting transcriptional regulator [Acidobacteriota bacterium]
MNAKLSIIEGENAGVVFPLNSPETLIGRENANQIALDDSSVSRRHCVVERRGKDFFISDLQSLNGTFVNGSAAENKRLKHQDKITIGKFALLFINDDEIAAQNEKDSELLFNNIQSGLDEAIGAMARDLTALLQISQKINSVRGLENLQNQLLELLFEVVPADKGVVLLIEDDLSKDVYSVFGLLRDNPKTETVSFSKTVVEHVFQSQAAILTNDLPTADHLSNSESLILFQTTSLLCVPLVLYGKTMGAIYLETNKQTARFDENHLRFIEAVAGIAAVAIENARQFDRLEAENRFLREQSLENRNNMIGVSPAIEKAFKFIAKAAPTDSNVLINGESGTGKELAARAIHENSRRRDKPFVAINCAALSDSLLESELFGHEKGAFTGAVQQKKGKIEIAEGGTLFLDEIGEMAINLQAKLLRVLQEREFERVGGVKPMKADIRLVAATNRDLEAEVKSGTFRQDLFYRLNVVRFTMPALRERKEDILLLAEKFAEKFARQINRRVRGISTKAKKLLLDYDFPGNVRELENAIERAVVLGSTEWILPEDLPENIWENSDFPVCESPNGNRMQTYHEVILETKKQLIRKAFKDAQGSYIEAAKLLDVHPNYLHRLIRNLNLKTELESRSF